MPDPVVVLDDAATVERLDAAGLRHHIDGLADDCEAAWGRNAGLELPGRYTSVREVVLAGMGGSAIAADMLRSLAAPGSRKPVHVVRGYDLPAFVDDASLVVACSHSGNTEETLSAYQQAVARGAPTVVVAKGGRLLDLARAAGAPAIAYQYEGGPRSAIGHQLMALLAIGERVGLLGRQSDAVAEAVTLLRGQRGELGVAVPAGGNPAKQLAARLFERLPVVVGGGQLAVAAYRWKTQFNENSKSWALFEEVPELGHNTIVGFGLPAAAVAQLHVVFLGHPSLSPRLLLHYDGTAEALRDAGVTSERVAALGTSALAQILTGAYHGDWVSFYLAIVNGVDPSPVGPIEKLKRHLAQG